MSSRPTSFESLIEAVPSALVGMDQVGVIQFANNQTESLFGYACEDLVGQPIQMLVPEHLWEVCSEHREEYFADPRTQPMGLDLPLSDANKTALRSRWTSVCPTWTPGRCCWLSRLRAR
jgi:two-component system sensor kinase FixL